MGADFNKQVSWEDLTSEDNDVVVDNVVVDNVVVDDVVVDDVVVDNDTKIKEEA